ncbi:ARM repeat-containing protein [Gonapodya prolifera JEL478]|uniref:Eukaryotic translation initiation factor 3 subunit K n=1 Tax=Gonapodya prolifera (strain JEL478) TaxID=1344416 RepID=A0A139AVM3_GONPJ|nr:ARM repeat-containing protein [Gonapodya prolifera JEL478]|eukprot:KXS20525.1 ARM repeat-containing protein [Gonapodya prolifera JEL478]
MPGLETKSGADCAGWARPQEIANIVETVARYNPENIEVLERYVTTQLNSDTYDRDANLALLKLYQFNPDPRNLEYVAAVLAKALTALPDPDFNLCLALITDDALNTHPVLQQLWEAQQLLERCSFVEFWRFVEDHAEVRDGALDACKGFDEHVRDFIARTTVLTCQTVSEQVLMDWLNLSAEEVREFVADKAWSYDEKDDSVVVLPVTKENAPKVKGEQEVVKFEQLKRIIGHSNEVY